MSRQVEQAATMDGHETSISGQDAPLSAAQRVAHGVRCMTCAGRDFSLAERRASQGYEGKAR
jgi:ABC-type xylose transport system substrate-binding protein